MRRLSMRKLYIFVTLGFLSLFTEYGAARTIVDAQDIIYEVVNESAMTVRVSNQNSGFFQNNNVELVIPETVVDCSTNSTTSEPYTVINMDNGSFKGCTGITSITITAPLSTIPTSCFENCTNLKSALLPATITTLSGNAFSGCSSMETITGFDNLISVGNYAFSGCSSLQSIAIPESVTTLGMSSFQNCTSLMEVNLDCKVTSLNSRLFMGCSVLETVVLPSELNSIQGEAFMDCKMLKCPTFPSTLTSIDNCAFQNCESLGTVTLIPGLKLVGGVFRGAGIEKIVFPAEPLTLSSNTFTNVSKLKELTLPGWLTSVPSSCFQYCYDLETLTFEDGVEIIGNNSFSQSPKLTTINLPSSLQIIDVSAFNTCAELTGVILPDNLQEIKSDAFRYCAKLGATKIPAPTNLGAHCLCATNLTKLEFAEDAYGTYDSESFISTVRYYESDQPYVTEIVYPGTLKEIPAGLFHKFKALQKVVIGKGIEKIGMRAFMQDPELTTVELPEGLKRIELNAFYEDSKLTGVKFREGLEYIGNLAFYKTALTEAKFPSTLLQIGEESTNYAVAGAFEQTPLEVVEFKSCETIETRSFYQCENLTSLTLPSNLKLIGERCFSGCISLPELEIPDTEARVRTDAFSSCTSLKKIILPAYATFESQVFAECGLTEINFPENACYFDGKGHFSANKSLERVSLPGWLETVNEQMFYSCENLKYLDLGEGIETIMKRGFYKTGILYLDMPSSLVEIGEEAFCETNLSGAKSEEDTPGLLKLHKGLKLGKNSFQKTSLTAIEFPDADQEYAEMPIEFGYGAFSKSYGLNSISLPLWMTRVPAGLFDDARLVELLLSPATVAVEEYAFNNNIWLRDIEFPASLTDIGKYAFANGGSSTAGTVKDAFGVTYDEETGEKIYGTIVLEKDVKLGDYCFQNAKIINLIFKDCAEFGDGCFKSLISIESITLPSCMKEIPTEFCAGWIKLKNVTFPEDLVSIGDKAFQGCLSLGNVTIPETVTSIGASAFNSSGLTSVTLPHSNPTLGNSVFASCSKLTSVTIPCQQTKLPDYCFTGSSNLANIIWEMPEEGDRVDIELGYRAFYGCRVISMPDANVKLGAQCFYYNKGTSITWPSDDKSVELGEQAFSISSITSLTLPAGVTVVPNQCFQSCSYLTTVTLGPNVVSIGAESFWNCSKLINVELNDNLNYIGVKAFQNDPIVSIRIPDSVNKMDNECFSNCSKLTTVKLPASIKEVPYMAFYYCSSLNAIEIPANVKVIGEKAFYQCKKMTTLTLHEGLEIIGRNAFDNCVEIEELTIPSTVTKLEGYSFQNSGLKRVVNHASDIEFEYYCFNQCSQMTQFDSDAYIKKLQNNVFYKCTSLKKFNYTADTPISYYGVSTFEGCWALEDADFFHPIDASTGITSIFKDCKALTKFRLPKQFSAPASSMLNGCEKLQSIVWEHDSIFFGFQAADIAGAPLKGLSYAYGNNFRMPTSVNKVNSSITKFSGRGSYSNLTKPENSILMVNRDQRWKFITQGYGEVFDIVEMKDPRVDLYGDIFSVYNETTQQNSYTVNLRWLAPLSDFNVKPEGTTYHVYHTIAGGEEHQIGTLKCSAPIYKESDPDFQNIATYTIELTYSGDIDDKFVGQFTYQTDDTLKYESVNLIQRDRLVFDAVSHKRLDLSDYNGYNSWVAVCHRFVGPVLTDTDIPKKYGYRVEMEGYDYTILENNEPFIAGEDEKYYHVKEMPAEDKSSALLEVSSTMAMPALSVKGMYSYNDVLNDRTFEQMDCAADYKLSERYALVYDISSDMVGQTVLDVATKRNYNMVSSITAYKITDSGRELKKSYTSKSDIASGVMVINNPEPGDKYMLTFNSEFRGEFGSMVLTIPGVPQLASSMSLSYVDHFFNDYLENYSQRHLDGVAMKAQITLNPVCPNMAGESFIPAEGDYHLGMMRNMGLVRYNKPARAAASDDRDPLVTDDSDDQLIHHVEGRVAGTDDDMCDDCKSGIGLDTTGSNWVYEDHVVVPWGTDANLTYTPRLYARVPGSTIGYDEDQWMAADAPVGQDVYIYTNIEDMEMVGNEEGIYYNLQGIRVQTPQRGVPVIKVTPRGAAKTLRLR